MLFLLYDHRYYYYYYYCYFLLARDTRLSATKTIRAQATRPIPWSTHVFTMFPPGRSPRFAFGSVRYLAVVRPTRTRRRACGVYPRVSVPDRPRTSASNGFGRNSRPTDRDRQNYRKKISHRRPLLYSTCRSGLRDTRLITTGLVHDIRSARQPARTSRVQSDRHGTERVTYNHRGTVS